MRWCVLLVGFLSGAQAFAPAPIRWAGLRARSFFLVPKALPHEAAITSQALTVADQRGPQFVVHSDQTIRLERSNLCIEASGSDIGDVARVNHCTGDRLLQKWIWLSQGDGQDMIQLAGTRNCLAAVEERGGLNVELRECDNSVAEAWTFEERVPKPTQVAAQDASDVVRHAAIFVILVSSLGALGFSSWLRRRQMKVRLATTRWSDFTLRHDNGGVALTLPLKENQDSAPSTPDADVMEAHRQVADDDVLKAHRKISDDDVMKTHRMVLAVMATCPIVVDDDAGAKQPPRVPSSILMNMPKPYTAPPVTGDEWVALQLPLYQERIIFLGETIDDSMINKCISQMLCMDADADAPIYLYINSPGGSVISGLALYDTIQHIRSEVITINLGIAMSTASLLLGAGRKGKRVALANSRVMIHAPSPGDASEAAAFDVRVEADQIYHIKDTVISIYADQTGKTREQIERDIAGGDYYMSAQQALEYGLVDMLVTKPKE